MKEVIRLGLNEGLKRAKTYEDLKHLEKIINDLTYNDLYFDFKMKRSGYKAFDFTPITYWGKESDITDNERVEYLIDDGISEGNSLVRNLHRNIEII